MEVGVCSSILSIFLSEGGFEEFRGEFVESNGGSKVVWCLFLGIFALTCTSL